MALRAKLELDTQPYEQGINRAEAFTQKWAHKQERFLTKSFFHAFGAAEVLKQISEAVKEASRISEESTKLDISTDRFQALEFVAKQTGLSVEEMSDHIKELPRDIQEAIDKFEKMGQAIPSKTIENLADASDAMREATKGPFAANALSAIWTAFKRIALGTAGGIETVAGNISPLAGSKGEEVKRSGEDWFTHLFLDMMSNPALVKMQGRMTGELAKKLIQRNADTATEEEELAKFEQARKEALEKAKPAIEHALSPFRLEVFDALNKMGGFGQGAGQSALVAPLDRIARATEQTAENTADSGTPY